MAKLKMTITQDLEINPEHYLLGDKYVVAYTLVDGRMEEVFSDKPPTPAQLAKMVEQEMALGACSPEEMLDKFTVVVVPADDGGFC